MRLKHNKKIVKLINHNYAYNSLTNFEYEVNEMTGNGNCENLLKDDKVAKIGILPLKKMASAYVRVNI